MAGEAKFLQINAVIALPVAEVCHLGWEGPLCMAGCVLQSGDREKDLGFVVNKQLDTHLL